MDRMAPAVLAGPLVGLRPVARHGDHGPDSRAGRSPRDRRRAAAVVPDPSHRQPLPGRGLAGIGTREPDRPRVRAVRLAVDPGRDRSAEARAVPQADPCRAADRYAAPFRRRGPAEGLATADPAGGLPSSPLADDRDARDEPAGEAGECPGFRPGARPLGRPDPPPLAGRLRSSRPSSPSGSPRWPVRAPRRPSRPIATA